VSTGQGLEIPSGLATLYALLRNDYRLNGIEITRAPAPDSFNEGIIVGTTKEGIDEATVDNLRLLSTPAYSIICVSVTESTARSVYSLCDEIVEQSAGTSFGILTKSFVRRKSIDLTDRDKVTNQMKYRYGGVYDAYVIAPR
jgi:hypothetical protein